MAGIVAGSLLLSLAALLAARALASLAGLNAVGVQQLAIPLTVWLLLSGLLILLIPDTSLIDEGHRQALLLSLAGAAVLCLAPVARFLLHQRASRSTSG